MYLNGVQLEAASVLIPSVSDLHHRVLSHQYDVGGVLRAGTENVLAFWAAPGWSQLTWPDKGGAAGSSAGRSFDTSAAPLVMAQLSLCGAAETDDCSLLVATSASSGWKARPSTIEHRGSWQWGDYGGQIGEGAFGDVWKGILDESSAGGVPSYMVAVKTSKEAKGEGAEEMMREATVMAQVSGHPNLVSLIGVVTSGTPLMLLLSLCEHGALLSVLKERKQQH